MTEILSGRDIQLVWLGASCVGYVAFEVARARSAPVRVRTIGSGVLLVCLAALVWSLMVFGAERQLRAPPSAQPVQPAPDIPPG